MSLSSVAGLLWRWTNDLVFSYLPGGDQSRGAVWLTVQTVQSVQGVHCCTANNVTLSDRRSVEPTSPPIPVTK